MSRSAHQQPQQRGLALAVAADQSQPPGGIESEGHMLKNRRIGAIISEGKITNGNLHKGFSASLFIEVGCAMPDGRRGMFILTHAKRRGVFDPFLSPICVCFG